MKKFLLTIVLAVTVAASLPLYGCSQYGESSETFTGALSQNTYSSEYSTVRGFVREELCGLTADCTLLDYKVESRLSAQQSAGLGIDEENTAVYPVKIQYTSPQDSRAHTANAYILENNGVYKYFVPLPRTGEAVTKSYYNSVVQNPAYQNCTTETTYSGRIFSIEFTYFQTCMFDYDKAYFNQTIPAMQTDFYMAETANGFKYYARLPQMGDAGYYTKSEINAWVKQTYGPDYYLEGFFLKKGGKTYDLDNFDSISQLSSFIYAANFDCTYFEKTDYGFRMDKSKFISAVYALAGEMGEDADELQLQINEHVQNLDIRYYVADGHLAKMDLVVQAIIGNGYKDIMAIEVHTEYKNFGTTTITLPRTEETCK